MLGLSEGASRFTMSKAGGAMQGYLQSKLAAQAASVEGDPSAT
jgi:hypothetical protein